MATVSSALAHVKQDVGKYLTDEAIEAACKATGHRWRVRQFGPVQTIHLFVLQVLAFNTAITHLRLLAGHAVNAAAYCKARMRLPLAALQQLLRDSALAMRQALGIGDSHLWCGLRPLLVDASSTITPDMPDLQKAFGQPSGQKPGCGFPVPKVLGIFDAFTGLVLEMICFPLFTHEQSKVWQLHPLLKAGDLLVADRGFCSFAHLAMLYARNVMGCFRMHQRQIVDFRPHRKARGKLPKGRRKGRPNSTYVRRLGKHDQIVRWLRPTLVFKPKWMSLAQFEALPAELEIRELRYTIPSKGQRTRCVTIATTLLDPLKYPKEKIAELYGVRWRVETHFAELKTTLKMRKVKCQTPDGVKKELVIYCLVYNLVHAVMTEAAARQQTTPERISFVDALRWMLSAAPGEAVPDLVVNPVRPGRHEPRVIKDLQDTYPKMTKPRKELRKTLKSQAKSLK